VGCYTSPHLLAYNERVRIDRSPVDDVALGDAFARVEAARLAAGGVALTYFEFGTLAALEVFTARAVDVLILEVGLGGRLDAVNAYDADCAVVTTIALDHTDWLGGSRESIGFEKAGIFRTDQPAICADPDPPQSLLAQASKVGADLYCWAAISAISETSSNGRSGRAAVCGAAVWRIRPARPGPVAQCLCCACRHRGAQATAAGPDAGAATRADRTGPAGTLSGYPSPAAGRSFSMWHTIHRPSAASPTSSATCLSLPGRSRSSACLATRTSPARWRRWRARSTCWLLADLDGARGASAASWRESCGAALGGSVECFASPAAAFARSAELAGEDDRIVVFGSFYTVAAVMRSMQNGR
jgi:dihydrofolate synthase/folylpolyglutamate synthase